MTYVALAEAATLALVVLAFLAHLQTLHRSYERKLWRLLEVNANLTQGQPAAPPAYVAPEPDRSEDERFVTTPEREPSFQ